MLNRHQYTVPYIQKTLLHIAFSAILTAGKEQNEIIEVYLQDINKSDLKNFKLSSTYRIVF